MQYGGWETRRRFRRPAARELTHVRLGIYPDGGMARTRLWGELTDRGRDDLVLRWYNLLPVIQVERILGEYGMDEADAEAVANARPLTGCRDLPEVLRGSCRSDGRPVRGELRMISLIIRKQTSRVRAQYRPDDQHGSGGCDRPGPKRPDRSPIGPG